MSILQNQCNYENDPNTEKALNLDSRQTSAYSENSIQFAQNFTIEHTFEEHQEVVEAISKVIELAPQQLTAYQRRGNSYYQLGRFRQAQRDFSTIMELSRHPHPLTIFKLANCHLKLSNVGQAQLYFKNGLNSLLKNSIPDLIQIYSMSRNKIVSVRKDVEVYQRGTSQFDEQMVREGLNVLDGIDKQLRKRELEGTQNSINFSECKDEVFSLDEEYPEEHEAKVTQDELKQIKNQLINMSQNFFLDQALTCGSQYYNLLYRMMISQFMSLQVINSSKHTHIYRKQALLHKLLKAPEEVKKISGLNRLVSAPFQIMAQIKELPMTCFVMHLAEKIKNHTRNREEQISDFIAAAIENLQSDRSFNRDLELALEDQDSGYLVTFMEVVREGGHKISTSIFDSAGKQLSFAEKVLVAHMTLLTKKIFDMPLTELKRTFKNKKTFSSMVKEALSPSSDEYQPPIEEQNDLTTINQTEAQPERMKSLPKKSNRFKTWLGNICCFRKAQM